MSENTALSGMAKNTVSKKLSETKSSKRLRWSEVLEVDLAAEKMMEEKGTKEREKKETKEMEQTKEIRGELNQMNKVTPEKTPKEVKKVVRIKKKNVKKRVGKGESVNKIDKEKKNILNQVENEGIKKENNVENIKKEQNKNEKVDNKDEKVDNKDERVGNKDEKENANVPEIIGKASVLKEKTFWEEVASVEKETKISKPKKPTKFSSEIINSWENNSVENVQKSFSTKVHPVDNKVVSAQRLEWEQMAREEEEEKKKRSLIDKELRPKAKLMREFWGNTEIHGQDIAGPIPGRKRLAARAAAWAAEAGKTKSSFEATAAVVAATGQPPTLAEVKGRRKVPWVTPNMENEGQEKRPSSTGEDLEIRKSRWNRAAEEAEKPPSPQQAPPRGIGLGVDERRVAWNEKTAEGGGGGLRWPVGGGGGALKPADASGLLGMEEKVERRKKFWMNVVNNEKNKYAINK